VAQRVGRGIALLFHDRGTRRGWEVSSTPRPHFTPGKDRVPILQEAENLVPTGIRSRTLHPVAQSLYRLGYRAHKTQRVVVTNYHYTLRNDPEECGPQLPRGGSLKSNIILLVPVTRRNPTTCITYLYVINHLVRIRNRKKPFCLVSIHHHIKPSLPFRCSNHNFTDYAYMHVWSLSFTQHAPPISSSWKTTDFLLCNFLKSPVFSSLSAETCVDNKVVSASAIFLSASPRSAFASTRSLSASMDIIIQAVNVTTESLRNGIISM